MNTDLIDAGGFTPVIDALVQQYDLVTAAIFGRVWRYCQGDTGYCYASVERIGMELGLSRWTVLRRLKLLVAEGYLHDHSPGLRNKPHSYSVTRKMFSITKGVAKSNTGVAGINTGVAEITNGCSTEPLEETNKKQLKKEDEERNSASALRASDPAAPPPTTSPSSFFTVKNYQDITIRKYYRMLKADPLSDAVPGILAILGTWNIPAQNIATAIAYLEAKGYDKEPA